MSAKTPKEVSAYMAKLGRKGGMNGRGKPKKRPAGYYAKIAREAAAKRD